MNEQVVKGINKIIIEAGQKGMDYYYANLEVEIKKDNSLVTKADLELEEMIAKGLKKLMPEAIFAGEEDFSSYDETEKIKKAEEVVKQRYIWAVDPIDGTTNYVHRFADFTVSIGLLISDDQKLKPIVGAIYKPCHDKLYYTDGEKSYLVINASKGGITIELGKVIYKTSDLNNHIFVLDSDRINKYNLSFFKNVRALGGMAEQVVSVAADETMATIAHAHLWDVVAALAICKQLDINFYDMKSGKRTEGFRLSDFDFSEAISWRLNNDYFVGNNSAFELIFDKLKK